MSGINILMIQVLLSFAALLSIAGRSKGLLPYLFWFFLLSSIICAFYVVHRYRNHYKMLAILVLSLTISLLHVVALPEVYQMGRDNIFEAQYAQSIVDTGSWDRTEGTGFAENYYGHNPVLHFVVAFSSLTTGLDSYTLLRYFFFFFIRLFITVLAFLVISTMVKSDYVSYMSTLIFVGSAGMAFIGATRRGIASIFVLLSIYCILKTMDSEHSNIWNILFIFFSGLIVIANHSIAYYFLLFLIGAWLFSKIVKLIPINRQEYSFPNIFPKLLYYGVVLLIWEMLSRVFLVGDMSYLVNILDILSGSSGTLAIPSLYRVYELFIIYGAQLLFVLFGSVGFMVFVRNVISRRTLRRKWARHEFFLIYFAIFGFTLYFVSFLLMRTSLDVAVLIVLWFFVLPISIFTGYVLARFRKSSLYVPYAMVIILLLFSGSLMMGLFTPRISNRLPWEDIVLGDDERANTAQVYMAGQWMGSNQSNRMLGDITVFEIFSGFFGHEVNSDPDWQRQLYSLDRPTLDYIISKDFEFGSYRHVRYRAPIDYIIMNRALSEYGSVYFNEPIEVSTIVHDSHENLDRLYDNGQMIIYEIDRE